MSASRGPPKGVFLNGVWNCHCNPRQPALHLQTKKLGDNHGRWFRKCPGDRCGFFLWDDDAHLRQPGALANNSRTEPARFNPPTPSRRQPSPPPPYTIELSPSEPSRKRTRAVSENQDDDDEFGQVDDYELKQVMAQIETPIKPARTNSFATPAAKRLKLSWQAEQSTASTAHGLQTPQTDQRTSVNPFASSYPARGGSLFTPSQVNEDEMHQIATPSSSFDSTPTPSRSSNATTEDLVTSVFSLLENSNVSLGDHTANNLRTLLSKHAKIAQGYKAGKNVSQATIKAKEAKITELGHRANTLEAEVEAQKAMVKYLQQLLPDGQDDLLDP
ncbi:hypothetical protein EJ02DRAFT_465644 [Clathrospora elynae]|uniref:GRF-type domain-containing protein n=1 Tax=Clathrospora elynae TaxID=706981 RepID=A0A6A5SPR0_9PLEO|nr:hypothetical protein EJ02DRAFT_465644 [Clathrospora elynae]